MIGRWSSWLAPAAARRGQRRRRVVPLWRDRRAMTATSLLAATVALGAGGWIWHSGHVGRLVARAEARAIRASADLGFEIREVFVVGRKRTPKDQLIAALGTDRGQPILGVDLEAARLRVRALPWVRSVSIERLLPDTLVVRLIEREPMALWQQGGVFSLVDDGGEIVPAPVSGAFTDLLIVVGEDAPANAMALLAVLNEEPELRPLVKAAVRVGGRRWNLHIEGGLEVRLPDDDPAQAWRLLARYQRSYRLLEKGLQTVDLRFSDRLVVRRLPEPAAEGQPGDAKPGDRPARGGRHGA